MGKYPTYVEMANAIRAAIAGVGGGGVPVGGSTGEVLTKASAVDYDTTWAAAPAAPNGLPTGGTAGQALIKNTATNYDASFTTIGTVPNGGAAFQVLAKATAADYSTAWVNVSSYSLGSRGITDTTVRTSTSATTLTATGLTFTVTSGTMYHLKALGTFRSAATTTGLALGFSTTVATTYCGWGVQIEQAAPGTDQNYTANATALGTVLVSTGVVAANTDYAWEIEGRFQPSASGTITIGFRSEIAASQITWQAGALAMLTAVA